MAAFNIVTWDATNNRNKQVPSASSAFDFSSVRIGTDNLVISEASSSAFSFNSKKLSNVTDPSSAQDAATKNYVDAAVAGATSFTYVAAASAVNQNVGAFSGTSLDGVTLSSGVSYILLMGQSTGSQNGVWLYNGSGAALTRPVSGSWASAASAVAGAMIEVGFGGAQYGNQIYSLNAAGTVGSSSLAFSNEGFNPGNMPGDLLPYVGGSLNLGSSTKYFASAVINSIKGNSDSNANVNVNSRNLNDSAGVISVDYSGRQLRTGATPKLDWSGTDVSLNTRKLINVVNPTAAQDAATKNYVDAADALKANSDLGNLITTSINQDLLPDSDNGRSLGSAALRWAAGYISALNDGSDFQSVDVSGRTLVDDTGAQLSISWNLRQLYASNGALQLSWNSAGTILSGAALDMGNHGISNAFQISSNDSITAGNNFSMTAGSANFGGTLNMNGNAIDMGTAQIHNVVNPSSAQDAATKNYVDTAVGSISSFTKVAAVAQNNVTISAPGFTVLDGVTLVSGTDLILLQSQSTASQNGVWRFNGTGSPLTRPASGPWMSGAVIASGALVEVLFGGNRYADSIYSVNVGGTIDTSSLNLAITGFNPGLIPSSLIPAVQLDIGAVGKYFGDAYINQLHSNSSGNPIVVNLTSMYLIDHTAAAKSIDWDNRLMYDSTGTAISVDYQARQLKSGSTVKLDWSGTDVSLSTRKLINVVDPSAAQDAATKNYVDAQTALKANKALDNLASVAINASLLPATDIAIDLGSAAKRWNKLYAVQANDASDVKAVDFSLRRLFSSAGAAVADFAAANLDLLSNKIVNLANPSGAQDAATKAYVDAVATGLTPKASVQAATAAVLSNTPAYANGTAGVGATLTASTNGALVVDGYTVLLNQRVLVKNQAAGLQNGIYTLTTLGTGGVPYVLTRATDADTCQPASNPKVTSGIHMFIEQGSTYSGQGWVLTTIDPITLGTTALVFSQFSSIAAYTAGNGIDITGSAISARIDGNALQFSGGVITLTLNGATLNSSASGLKVSDLGITAAQIANNTITAAQIANATITATQLAASVAGNGLTGGAGAALSVVVADTTLVVGASGVALNASDAYVNDNAGTVSVGQVVYIKTNGHIDLASNVVASNLVDIGIVKDATIAAAGTGNVWTQEGIKISGFSGLTPGAPVYVSNTAGALTQSTSGFTAGQFVYQVGYALTASVIRFEPSFLIEW